MVKSAGFYVQDTCMHVQYKLTLIAKSMTRQAPRDCRGNYSNLVDLECGNCYEANVHHETRRIHLFM